MCQWRKRGPELGRGLTPLVTQGSSSSLANELDIEQKTRPEGLGGGGGIRL